MFEIMKILRKDSYQADERVNLSTLRVGCTVGFGFMPQRNISGCRLNIKAINSYEYGKDKFLSYLLDNEETDISLIVTRNENSREAHLALSQRVEERLFPMLFLTNQPESWFSMKEGTLLKTSHRVMGMQQSWIASSYKLVMIDKGSFFEGDHGKINNLKAGRHFDYALFVDEENEHAIEAEKYEDGTLVVYSTVYRPSTDIGEITYPPIRSNSRPAILKSALIPPLELPEHAPETETDLPHTEIKLNGDARSEEEVKETHLSDDILALDTKLAARIIDEAQLNKISIAELIRKVIDLPANINDQVMIAFSLSGTEQTTLARRYNIPASDHEGIKKSVIKELQQFVGHKKGK